MHIPQLWVYLPYAYTSIMGIPTLCIYLVEAPLPDSQMFIRTQVRIPITLEQKLLKQRLWEGQRLAMNLK